MNDINKPFFDIEANKKQKKWFFEKSKHLKLWANKSFYMHPDMKWYTTF